MAGVVHRDGPVDPGTDVLDAELRDEVVGELERLGGEVAGPRRVPFRYQPWVPVVDHRDAGSGWGDDGVERLEHVEEVAGEARRGLGLTRVARRLAAAGLCARELDGRARGLEQAHRADADLGGELIDDTGDEQGDGRHQAGAYAASPASHTARTSRVVRSNATTSARPPTPCVA